MTPEGVGITPPQKLGPYQPRLKFGKQACCVIELRKREEAAGVAQKLRELANQVERLKDR
jgi:hypothetical protein